MMWMILGLLGSVAAVSAAEALSLPRGGSDDDDAPQGRGSDDDDDPTPFPDAPPDNALHGVLSDAWGMADDSATAPPDAWIGLFDNLGERVHSSDTTPWPAPPDPVALGGTDGDDRLSGAGQDDSLAGGAGDDTLLGAGGDDWLGGGPGDDSVLGGTGADTLLAGQGADSLQAGQGDDLLVVGGQGATAMGGAGADTLIGGAGGFLNGGSGDDQLIAAGDSNLHGGSGADAFTLGDWLADDGAGPAHIHDFTRDEDQLALHYDPAQGAPDVSVSYPDGDPTTAQIRLAGQIVATVANAPGLSSLDIALVPEAGPPRAAE